MRSIHVTCNNDCEYTFHNLTKTIESLGFEIQCRVFARQRVTMINAAVLEPREEPSLLPLSTNRYKCTHYAPRRNYRLSCAGKPTLEPPSPPYCPTTLECSGLFSAVGDGLSPLSAFSRFTGHLNKLDFFQSFFFVRTEARPNKSTNSVARIIHRVERENCCILSH